MLRVILTRSYDALIHWQGQMLKSLVEMRMAQLGRMEQENELKIKRNKISLIIARLKNKK